MSRRSLLRTALGAPFAAALSRRLPASAAAPIRIGSASGSLNLTIAALMRQERLLESFGLAPEILLVADGAKLLGGVVGGSVDVVLNSGFGQMFPAVERGAALKVLAGGALLPALTLFSAKPGIRTLKDLEGRVIGTGSIGALAHQLTVTLLRKYQVDLSHVQFVNIGSSDDIFRAVTARTVDAGVGETSMLEDAASYGAHALEHGNMSVELREYTFQGAWTSDRNLTMHRDLLVRSLAAYAKLYRFVQTPAAQDAFMRASRTAFPTAPARDQLALWNYIQNYKPFAVDLVLEPERLRYMQQLNVDFMVQRQVLPFERVADMSLARDALKMLG